MSYLSGRSNLTATPLSGINPVPGPPFAYNRSRVKIGPLSLASQKLLALSLLWRRGLSKLEAAGKRAFCSAIEFGKKEYLESR